MMLFAIYDEAPLYALFAIICRYFSILDAGALLHTMSTLRAFSLSRRARITRLFRCYFWCCRHFHASWLRHYFSSMPLRHWHYIRLMPYFIYWWLRFSSFDDFISLHFLMIFAVDFRFHAICLLMLLFWFWYYWCFRCLRLLSFSLITFALLLMPLFSCFLCAMLIFLSFFHLIAIDAIIFIFHFDTQLFYWCWYFIELILLPFISFALRCCHYAFIIIIIVDVLIWYAADAFAAFWLIAFVAFIIDWYYYFFIITLLLLYFAMIRHYSLMLIFSSLFSSLLLMMRHIFAATWYFADDFHIISLLPHFAITLIDDLMPLSPFLWCRFLMPPFRY